jgi:hypothetical protein
MFLGGKVLPAREADNLTAICILLENMGYSTSQNPMGFHGLLQESFNVLYFACIQMIVLYFVLFYLMSRKFIFNYNLNLNLI